MTKKKRWFFGTSVTYIGEITNNKIPREEETNFSNFIILFSTKPFSQTQKMKVR